MGDLWRSIKSWLTGIPDEPQDYPGRATAESIAWAFETEPEVTTALDGGGISKMGVTWHGREVQISWYSHGQLRDISIDGDKMFPFGRGSEAIFEAALRRADGLIAERLAALDVEARRD